MSCPCVGRCPAGALERWELPLTTLAGARDRLVEALRHEGLQCFGELRISAGSAPNRASTTVILLSAAAPDLLATILALYPGLGPLMVLQISVRTSPVGVRLDLLRPKALLSLCDRELCGLESEQGARAHRALDLLKTYGAQPSCASAEEQPPQGSGAGSPQPS